MKVCSNCSNEYDENLENCPFCGFAEEAEKESAQPVQQNYAGDNSRQVNFCQYCGSPVEPNSVFCSNCGSKLVGGVPNNSMNNQFKQRVQNNEFVQSFRDDINNSKSIGMIKEKAQNTAAKAKTLSSEQVRKIIIAAVIVFVIALGVIIGTNIHKCDECEKIYLGKKYTISFWGQREDICKECYTDLFGD
ncbi:MAG: zinc ribbon domain-containing protein [Clostridia bacterium]|nr:zinc ribbon domain-containing protein [Clostridia bacterium]